MNLPRGSEGQLFVYVFTDRDPRTEDWWGGIDSASPTGPNGAFVPADIQGIEIYNHPSILPDQFDSGRDALCGVVVVWTKWDN